MVHLFPCMDHKIECDRSAEEICARLKKVTDTRTGAFHNYTGTEFRGKIGPAGFRLFCDFRSGRFSSPHFFRSSTDWKN